MWWRMTSKPPGSREMGYVLALSQVGLEMVAPIAIGVGLDVWLGSMPWITIGGVGLGLVGGLVHLLAILNRMDRSDSDAGEGDKKT